MNDLIFYIKQGVFHILDTEALDHLYFIISFCLLYTFKDWKKILGLVTAFTIGHCLTLFISGLELISVNMDLVETLIPITILLSCINNFYNLFININQSKKQLIISYVILLFFGLIHGLGFSNYIKMILFDDESIVLPLLGFNIGIELAQLLIIAFFIMIMSSIQKIQTNLKWIKFTINLILVILVIHMVWK